MAELTIYQFARETMQAIVSKLIDLSDETHGFVSPASHHWSDSDASAMLLCGKGVGMDAVPAVTDGAQVWLARAAMPFSLERAATATLYARLAEFTDALIDDAFAQTGLLSDISPEWIGANPRFLPVLMHAVGTFSKQELVGLIGAVSDTRVSRRAAAELAELIRQSQGHRVGREQVRQRIRATVEGIVRDLVGKLLLEEFVATALTRSALPFRRERDYSALTGVVYDFRADFVIPDEDNPKAFVEVRKSSTRHASLYAKDKMFSAINWKGRHECCVGVLVVDGPWTMASLDIMSKVFDYVVPIASVPEVAGRIRAYLDGDLTVLRWLIRFQIEKYNPPS